VSIATPISWQAIGFLLLFALCAAGTFLLLGTYPRIQVAQGSLVPDHGIATLYPSRPGVVAAVQVVEGQLVQPGDPLVLVRAEDALTGGGSASEEILKAVRAQDRKLELQSDETSRAAVANEAGLTAQIAGARLELEQLGGEIAGQERLLALAERSFKDIGSLTERGFISRRDVAARESELIRVRQQLTQLRRQQIAKETEAAEARNAILQLRAATRAQRTGNDASRSALRQQMTQSDVSSGYSVTSPVKGKVTAVLARPGQAASLGSALLTVVPDGAGLRAELYLPSSSAAFVAPGQEVRLAVDAFPPERFGSITGRILSISDSVVVPAGAPAGRPTYLAIVEIPQPWLIAFGKRQPLMPGMAVVARIVTERRTLLEWLFEPVFAAMGR